MPVLGPLSLRWSVLRRPDAALLDDDVVVKAPAIDLDLTEGNEPAFHFGAGTSPLCSRNAPTRAPCPTASPRRGVRILPTRRGAPATSPRTRSRPGRDRTATSSPRDRSYRSARPGSPASPPLSPGPQSSEPPMPDGRVRSSRAEATAPPHRQRTAPGRDDCWSRTPLRT